MIRSASRRFFLSLSLVGLLLSPAVMAAQEFPSNEAFDLTRYKGKVVYVDFWASWCAPCRASFPFMADISREFGDNLVVVAINVDENKADALAFLELFDAPFEIVYDQKAELAAGFRLPTMPTSYLFDREGKLIIRHKTFKNKDIPELKATIAQAVQSSAQVNH